jgi:acetolactate synthase-1/2/3 large subunit
MKVSDAAAQYLAKEGVRVIFGYQGGAITHLIDSFDKAGIRYVQNYNEQGSSFAADAYARISENGLGVAIGTNGPGATNMVTGIANAFCDSVPVLFLTGQVHTFAMKKDPKVRQESFQEIDILSITRSITKYAVTVLDKDQVIPELAKAIAIAKEGRPGPVLVDLPVDVQGYQTDVTDAERGKTDGSLLYSGNQPEPATQEKIRHAARLLKQAKRPLILAGGGIRLSGAVAEFRRMVHRTKIPVAASMMGLDAYPHDDPYFVGFIGSYGNRYANLAVQSADVILVLGSRLDMRQTGKRRDLFASGAKVIHVDIDETELGHFIEEDMEISCSILTFLRTLGATAEDSSEPYREWMEQIAEWKRRYPEEGELSVRPECAACNPNVVMKYIGKQLPPHTIVCSDVGQNQLWLSQSLRIGGGQFRILNSGGLGAMGYSLPAAIGAHYADPEAAVVACMGDGGLQMNIQELQLVGQEQLPVTLVVMNNHALGLIRDTHEKYYDKRYVGSVWGFSMPDLKALAAAYRLHYAKANNPAELADIWTERRTPCIIEMEFTENTYVYPELLGNDGLDHQMPYRDEENHIKEEKA